MGKDGHTQLLPASPAVHRGYHHEPFRMDTPRSSQIQFPSEERRWPEYRSGDQARERCTSLPEEIKPISSFFVVDGQGDVDAAGCLAFLMRTCGQPFL
jgi:hypothetical protein